MTDVEFMELCKQEVRKDYVAQTGKEIATDDIHIVWYCRDNNELYADVCTKIENVCISKEYKEYL